MPIGSDRSGHIEPNQKVATWVLLHLNDTQPGLVQPMGDESSTAQVHPQKLSRALMEAAQEKGAQLRIGEVQNITSHNNAVTGEAFVCKQHHALL